MARKPSSEALELVKYWGDYLEGQGVVEKMRNPSKNWYHVWTTRRNFHQGDAEATAAYLEGLGAGLVMGHDNLLRWLLGNKDPNTTMDVPREWHSVKYELPN